VHQILEEGYTIEQFIEGGRSRTGKLLRPKLGLLSMLLTALKNGACEDLIFVPVSIGYDRVLEEKSYLHEINGGQKKTENLRQVVRARKFLKRRHGKVYLQFSEPLSVDALAERWGTPLKEMGDKEFTRFSRALGNRIIHAIGRVSVVTPHAITAAAILNSGRERLDFQELTTTVEIYLNHLYAVGARLADTLIMDHHRAIARSMESYVQRKIVEAPEKDSGAPVGSCSYLLKEARRPFLEFYRNTCIAFFVPAAFTALAVLQKDAFQLPAADLHADYAFLQELLELEFVSDPDTPPEHHLRRSLKLFVEDAVLIPHPSLPDTFNVTAAGFRKLKLFAMFLKTLLESYWVVLSYLRQAPAEGEDAKERVRKITSFGNRMFRQKEIDHREALSRVTYENALEFFSGRGITGAGDRDPIDAFARNLQQALRCLKP
jgi:glycerol-3-phosphate O-acyltransferase